MSECFPSLKEFLEYVASGNRFAYLNVGPSQYFVLNGHVIVDEAGLADECLDLQIFEDFKPYTEPKKKKQIMLYRYTLETPIVGDVSSIHQGDWSNVEGQWFAKGTKVILKETKTIEVDDV